MKGCKGESGCLLGIVMDKSKNWQNHAHASRGIDLEHSVKSTFNHSLFSLPRCLTDFSHTSRHIQVGALLILRIAITEMLDSHFSFCFPSSVLFLAQRMCTAMRSGNSSTGSPTSGQGSMKACGRSNIILMSYSEAM